MDTLRTISKRFHTGSRIDPARDWLLLLTFAAIVLAAIIVWNIWAFDTVANGGIIGARTTPSTPVFSQSSLDTIRKVFAARAEEEAKYVTGTYQFADPSQ